MLEELKKYFEETPRDVVLKDWEDLAEFDKIGPTVSETVDFWHSHYGVISHQYIERKEQNTNSNKTPKYSGSYCLQ